MLPAPLTTQPASVGEGSALRQVRYVEAVTAGCCSLYQMLLLLPLPAPAPAPAQLSPISFSSQLLLPCPSFLVDLIPYFCFQLLLLPLSSRVPSFSCRSCCSRLGTSFYHGCNFQLLLRAAVALRVSESWPRVVLHFPIPLKLLLLAPAQGPPIPFPIPLSI